MSGIERVPREWRWAAALLCAPLIVLAFQDNSLFTPPGRLDPWLYLAFFRDLVEYKRNLFPATYYGSRLPFLLPGAGLHALFGTVTAGAIFHLMVHWVATLSVFFAAERIAGRRAAFLTALLFTVHPWVWFATGWDNPDGAAMAYFALSLALVLQAAGAERPRWRLVWAGAAAAAAVYTNLFLAMFVVWLPLYGIGTAPWRSRLGNLLAGAAGLTVVLSTVNRWIEGTWNFYGPSVQFAVQKGSASSNPEAAWRQDGLEPWLWFAAIVAAGALILLPRRREWTAATVVSVHFLVCGGAMWYLQATGPTVLGLSYYASYLLPLTFLTIAASFWSAVDELSARAFGAAVVAVSVGAFLFWSDRGGRLIPLWPAGRYAAVAVVAALLGTALLLGRRTASVAAAVAGLLALSAYVRARLPEDPHAWRKDYAVIGAALEQIGSAGSGRPVPFLLDEDGREDLAYTALASTYLNGYSVMGRRLPEDACRELPDPGQIVVVASRRADAASVAQAGVARCWGDAGLVPRMEGAVPVPLSDGPFTATIIRAVNDPARWRPLGPAPDGGLQVTPSPAPLPLDRWKVWVHPHDRGVFRKEGDGLWALTPRGTDYAFTYAPLRVPMEGRYRFTLRYAPAEGTIAFGAYRPSDFSWRGLRGRARPVHDDRELTFLVDLHAGETVDLLISNNKTPDSRRATVVLKELTAGVSVRR